MNTQTIDVSALANELVQVQAQKKQLEEREDAIKTALRDLDIGKHEAGPYTVSVIKNRALDENKLKHTYPITEYPHFYVQKPNTKIIQGTIAPMLYESLMSERGKPIVKVS